MWGGFFGPRGARLAGRLGMGLLAAVPHIYDDYRAGLAEGGHGPDAFRIAQPFGIVIADDPEASWPRVAPHLAYQWDSYSRYMVEGTDLPAPEPTDPERMRRPGPNGEPPFFQILTPEDAAAFFTGLADVVPLEEIYFFVSIAGMPEDLEARHVELICTQLRPLLADVGPVKVPR
jgi:alkanesulfonate monooxygenase SsuD/methylene tetrahydromethanopterin reductase-like flavin-dependent oxidoreductase (luciferase family)